MNILCIRKEGIKNVFEKTSKAKLSRPKIDLLNHDFYQFSFYEHLMHSKRHLKESLKSLQKWYLKKVLDASHASKNGISQHFLSLHTFELFYDTKLKLSASPY